ANNTNDAAGNAVIRDATTTTKRDRDTGTWTTGNFDSFASITTYPKVLAKVILPSTGRATFAICSEVANDVATPLAWQDLNANADFTPETGEPQAQGGATTFASPTLTSGIVFSQVSGGNDILPATNSAGETGALFTSKNGLGLEQFTFRM